MDLSNYEQLVALIRKLCKDMAVDDQDDFIQDVYLKLCKSDLQYASKAVVRKVVRQIKLDRLKKRGPKIIYDNELVERYPDDRL